MNGVEDKDLGWNHIMQEIVKLDGAFVETGVHGEAGSEMVKIATIHEYGTKSWTISSKQAFYMARVLMKIDPEAEPARFWGTYRKLVGKKMKIAERSFIRSTFDRERAKFQTGMDRVVDGVLKGGDAKAAMQRFALFTEAMFKQGLLKVKSPPNAGLTIALKGSAQPLVRDGHLKNAIKSVVKGT